MSDFEELKNFAIADILSVSGKEKTTRVIENHMNNLIEVSLIKGQQSQQAKIDELQARVDEALELLNNQHNTTTVGFVKNAINKILKGNKDEN